MRTLICKLVSPIILSVLFLFVPSDQHAAEHMPNGQIVLTDSVTPAEQLPATSQSQDPQVLTRWDTYEIIFGTFLSVIGLALIALSLLRWKTIDLTLFSFGILCFLYGARTRAFQFLFQYVNIHLARRIDQADLRMDFLNYFERALKEKFEEF